MEKFEIDQALNGASEKELQDMLNLLNEHDAKVKEAEAQYAAEAGRVIEEGVGALANVEGEINGTVNSAEAAAEEAAAKSALEDIK